MLKNSSKLPVFTKHLCRLMAVALWLLPLFAGAQTAPTHQVVDKIIAKVDNYVVLQSDLEIAYLQAISGENKKNPPNLKCKLLEQLVINKLLLAKADLDSVTIEDKQVDDQLERRMQYMISTIGSREKLESYYKKTVDQFKYELRKQVKEQMLANKMQESITRDIKVTPNEVKRFFSKIPADSLPYFSREVEVGQIVRFPKVGKVAKQEARKKLQGLKDRIDKGEDFEILAKVYSEDPGSGAEGGNLGFHGKGEMVGEFEAAALRLKPGQVSDIVESQFGFHLIQLIERKGSQYNSRHILIRPVNTASDIDDAKVFLDSLRSRIMLDSIKFEIAAKKYSDDEATKENGGLFRESATNTTRVPLEQLDPVVYFIIDTMQTGQITHPLSFRTEDGKDAVRILYFKSKTPPHEANLKDDYQKIQAAALQEKKNLTINTWFERTRGEVYINIDKEYNSCELMQGKIE